MAPLLNVDLVDRGRRLTKSTTNAAGVVLEAPEELVAAAGRLLGRTVTLDAYAMARVVRSEVGTRASVEKVAVAWVLRNDAADLNWSIARAVTFHRTASRDGRFGRQTSGRYASGLDPYESDLNIAESVLSAHFPDPTRGALKFVHKAAFGVQAGTRTYEEVLAEWRREGLEPRSVHGAADDFVVFTRGSADAGVA